MPLAEVETLFLSVTCFKFWALVTFRVRPEHRIYSAFSHAGHVTLQKNVPHDNFRLITSRQLSMSSVTTPGTCWYFCATPRLYQTIGRKGSIVTCRMSSFMLSHIHANKHCHPPPPKKSYFPKGFFVILYHYHQKNHRTVLF